MSRNSAIRFVLVIGFALLGSRRAGPERVDIGAKHDVPGPVNIRLDAKNQAKIIIGSTTMSFDEATNNFDVKVWNMPLGTTRLRLTFLNNSCSGCSDADDKSRGGVADDTDRDFFLDTVFPEAGLFLSSRETSSTKSAPTPTPVWGAAARTSPT